MFAKLLKQEFRATKNAMLVLCLTALGAGVLGGCAMGCLFRAEDMAQDLEGAVLILCGIVLGFSVLFIALAGVCAFFLMAARFYKRCFTDEGYLTFTLPVTTHQILLSGLVNAALNMLIAVAAVVVSFGILGLVGCSFVVDFWEVTWEMLPELWKTFCENMTWGIAGNMALVLYDLVIGCASEFITVMLSITVGALIAKKHKILAAFGAYYGINICLSVVSGVIVSFSLSYITDMMNTFAQVLIVPGALCTVLAVICYFLMYFLTNRKLNLP